MKASDMLMTIRDLFNSPGAFAKLLEEFTEEEVEGFRGEYERGEVMYLLAPDGKNPIAQSMEKGDGPEQRLIMAWSTPATAKKAYKTFSKVSPATALIRIPVSVLEDFDYCLDLAWEETGVPFELTKPSGMIIRHGHEPIIMEAGRLAE